MPHHLTQRLCPSEMATWSTARTLCFIGRWLRFWEQAIRKMSFEYKRPREAGKHFLGWLSVCYSIRIRFNAQNNPFCKRHSFIQSTLVFLPSWRICHIISSVQVEPAENDNRNLLCFRKVTILLFARRSVDRGRDVISIFIKRMKHYTKINHCYWWEANN